VTSLAKLKNWRMSALGVRWGKIVPARLAATTIIVVSVAELLLAAALTLGRAALLVGYVTAVLFFQLWLLPTGGGGKDKAFDM